MIVTRLDLLGTQRDGQHKEVTAGLGMHLNRRVARGGVNLLSPAASKKMGVVAAIAEIERDFRMEQIQSSLRRANAKLKVLGPPQAFGGDQNTDVLRRRARAETLATVAGALMASRAIATCGSDGAAA